MADMGQGELKSWMMMMYLWVMVPEHSHQYGIFGVKQIHKPEIRDIEHLGDPHKARHVVPCLNPIHELASWWDRDCICSL